MYTLRYPVTIEKDKPGYLATFPDFDDAVTWGETREDALKHAEGALMEAVAARIAHKDIIPLPSAARGRDIVTLPPQTAAKALLWITMCEEKVSRAELARRLHQKFAQVDRLFRPDHQSKMEQLASAFSALGKKMVIGISDSTA